MPYDESLSEPLTEPDTPNATKFDSRDGNYETHMRLDGFESLDNYYRRLSTLNTIWTGTWVDKASLREQDNLAIFDAIAGYLELTPYQKSRARTAFSELNLSELSSPGGIDTPLVAAMTAAVVVREDGRIYHPSRDPKRNDEPLTAFLSEQGYRERVIHSCYAKVKDRVDL